MDNNNFYFYAGPSSHEVSLSRQMQTSIFNKSCTHLAQTLPLTTSGEPTGAHWRCPWATCRVSCGRRQELCRHVLSIHLPCWIHCPTCFWRGGREEDFNRHLREQNCGPKPPREQYQIYVTKLILDWVLNDDVPVETAECYALNFVSERARELGKVEEWRDAWGSQVRRARRRRNHLPVYR